MTTKALAFLAPRLPSRGLWVLDVQSLEQQQGMASTVADRSNNVVPPGDSTVFQICFRTFICFSVDRVFLLLVGGALQGPLVFRKFGPLPGARSKGSAPKDPLEAPFCVAGPSVKSFGCAVQSVLIRKTTFLKRVMPTEAHMCAYIDEFCEYAKLCMYC